MTKRWNEHQMRAIETQGKDVCVSAGAGSGKTGVLVERFLRIVSEKRARVDEILVITFTDKATREMKGRIVESLNSAGLRDERRQVETAYISTIHGFCARLLQENPFEAGVNPDFRPLDDTESKRLQRAAFEAVIERAYAPRSADHDVTELVAAVQNERLFGTDIGDPLAALFAASTGILTKLRGAGWRLSRLMEDWAAGPDATEARMLLTVRELIDPVLVDIRAGIDRLRLVRSGAAYAMESGRRLVLQAAAPLEEALPGVAGWERLTVVVSQIVALGQSVQNALRGRRSNVGADAELEEILMEIQGAVTLARVLEALEAEREQEGALLCHRFLGLIARFWQEYDTLKRRKGAIDQTDLQSEAVFLLQDSEGVRNRYRNRFRYLLIDEFQDTDPLQMQLLELLHGPLGAPDAPNRLFLVGDVQQAIYGFRGADPTIFQGVEQTFRRTRVGEHISLADNYRSRPEALDAINGLFRQMWTGSEMTFTPLRAGATYNPKPTPSVECLMMNSRNRTQDVEIESAAIAARIEQMVSQNAIQLSNPADTRYGQAPEYGDIAILLRSLTNIEMYENALTARGIPYFVVGGGRGYYARREVRDILNVLTVLDTPLNDIALLATLRSPMVGLDAETLYRLARFAVQDELDVAAPLYLKLELFLERAEMPDDHRDALRQFHSMMDSLRRNEDQRSVGHLLEKIIETTRYDARLLVRPGGKRRLANVRKLLQIAMAESDHGVTDFIRRLKEIERISDREGDAPTEEEAANVVRILTIHKAKGLEFPIVFLADMGKGGTHTENSLFLCDTRTLALGAKLGEYRSATYRRLVAARQVAEASESTRVLYVAMTRAREHLVLSGATRARSRGDNWAEMVFPTLGATVPTEPTVRRSTTGVEMLLLPMERLAEA